MAKPDLIVLPLRPDTPELEAAAGLFDQYRVFYGQPSDMALARRFIAERLVRHESFVWLAWHQGRAVGLVQVYPGWSSIGCAPSDKLNDLYVMPQSRGLGVASALIQAVIDAARQRGAASVVLETAATNHGAQALYRRLGFVQDTEFLTFAHSLTPSRGAAA